MTRGPCVRTVAVAAVWVACTVGAEARAQEPAQVPPLVPPQVPIEVCLPAGLAEVVAAAIARAVPAAVAVGGLRSQATPGGVVVAIEHELARLDGEVAFASLASLAGDLPAAIRGEGDRWLVPFGLGYRLAAAPTTPDPGVTTFDGLALHPDLQDRIRLCAPDVDPVPWLLGMQHLLAHGQPENAGYGLWTTLDARTGVYQRDYAALLASAAADEGAVAIVPAPLALPPHLPQGWRASALAPLEGMALGVALVGPPAAGALEVVRRIVAERGAIAREAGLGPAPEDRLRLGPADVDRWLQHFAANVRGRGRSVERVADLLDYVFGGLFVVVIAAFWWRQRRGRWADDAGEAPGS